MKPPRCRSFGISGLLLAGALSIMDAEARAQSEEYHSWADASLQSFLIHFWSGMDDYLLHDFPGSWPTGYWTFAQGFDALLDGVERTGGEQYAGLIETFYAAQKRRGWFSGWYDDENWMALALIRAHDLTGKPEYLSVAEMLYVDIMGGWDSSCCGSKPGGIWWDKGMSQKATAANAGPVIAGARLAARTGNSAYLDFARQVYIFWISNMTFGEAGGLRVVDHILPSGEKVNWRFTYNEGLMIGAAVELHRATGEDVYLEHARRFATYMIGNECVVAKYGKVLSDGSDTSCTGDCHAFKGPAYRYLALLFEETGETAYGQVLASCAQSIWALARDQEETLFSVSWVGPPTKEASEPQMCAAVMALNLFAASSGPFPGSGSPSSRHEAEDATLLWMDLDDARPGYTGWGYLSGGEVEGAGVTFRAEVPVAGEHEIRLRCCAPRTDATRLVEIPEIQWSESATFPAAEAWTTRSWKAVLPSGSIQVSVSFRGQAGSAEPIEIDSLVIQPVASPFIRGDANGDGATDIGDAIFVLCSHFAAGPSPTCEKAADANDDGLMGISDPLFLLEYLFLDGPSLPTPQAACGDDPTDDELTCASFGGCP
jgi:predicted alpha-1,6-mannanase (GH76 family)